MGVVDVVEGIVGAMFGTIVVDDSLVVAVGLFAIVVAGDEKLIAVDDDGRGEMNAFVSVGAA